tara:strand:- start:1398 stop:2150 length:753 start_codon:yes stop_codon:yes gene_type:complete
MTFSATYFGSNGWLIEFGELCVLIDPWLTGNLSFPPGPWLIEGKLTKKLKVPSKVSIILLTQGLADHAHIPSLDLFSRSIPIVGSSSASKIVKKLGFKSVFGLKPGETKILDGLKIQATSGAAVPNLENGYLISHDYASLYIEPHGFLDEKIPIQKIDAVITPVVNLKLPFAGNFIQGKTILPEIIKRLNPLTVLASTVGGDTEFSGILNQLISIEGTQDKLSNDLSSKTYFINPVPGRLYKLKTYKVRR